MRIRSIQKHTRDDQQTSLNDYSQWERHSAGRMGVIPGVACRQIKRVSDWHLTNETQRRVPATVVNAIAGLDPLLICQHTVRGCC